MNNNFEKRNPEEVKKMFSGIAESYDRANRLMCFGLDKYWRKVLAKKAASLCQNAPLLDAACGSGDVAFAALKLGLPKGVVCADFCPELLQLAKSKLVAFKNATFAECDCSNLHDFADNTFGAITVAFGFRNFQDRQKCLFEFNRVLKKGGKLFILEVALSKSLSGKAVSFFMDCIIPQIAAFAGSNKDDYLYLSKTAKLFPDNNQIGEMFKKANFANFKRHYFLTSLNSVSIMEGEKL